MGWVHIIHQIVNNHKAEDVEADASKDLLMKR